MNKYGIMVVLVVFLSLFFAVFIEMKYLLATIFFGIIAVGLTPFSIHKVIDVRWSMALLFGLAIFASFPFKKLFQIDGVFQGALVTLVYACTLWIAGMGWRRSWAQE